MTVGDNVAYGLMVRKVPEGRARPARRRGARDGPPRRATSSASPAQLSGGQRQRVALARALVNRPRVLLLDEPLGALDLKLREEMQIELKAIQQQVGITFIYVTHDQEEALTMSDRLAVFNRGRIEQVGAPAEVYERPATRVRGRLRRDLEPAPRRGRAGDRRRRTARSRSGPRRSGSPSPTTPVGADEIVGDRDASARSSTSARTPATSSRSTPAPSSSSPSRTSTTSSMEALAARGQGGPADLEAAAQLPVADCGRRSARGRLERRRRSMDQAAGSSAALGVVAARASSAARAAARGGRRRRPAPEPADRASAHGEGALTVLAWPGYAENGSTDPAVDWVQPLRERDRLQGRRPGLRHVRRGVQPVHDQPRASST